MKTSRLLLKLQQESEIYKKHVKNPPVDGNSVDSIMSCYNYENFHELITIRPDEIGGSINTFEEKEVDEEEVKDLQMRMITTSRYMHQKIMSFVTL